ncbi:sulfatase-like hydrolase/transferase [Streptomyces sp. NPDC055632]
MPSSSPHPGREPSGTPRSAGLSRRGFAALAGIAAASAALTVPAATATATAAPVREAAPARVPRPPADRPDILWLVAEDHYPFLGSYGDRTARTPTLARLAREGIRYEHSHSGAPVCAPSRFALLSGVHPQSAGPAEHMRALGKVPDFLRGFPEYLRRAGYHCTNNSKTDYNTVVDMGATWDESSATAHWRDRPAGAPFFAVINDMTTHESSLFAARDGRTRPSEVRLPAHLPDTPEIRADFAHYYDAMETLDGRIAARLAEPETAGLAEDTVVFFYSDNGGVLPRSKRHCYDEGMRTALIVRFPGKWAHPAPRPAGRLGGGGRCDLGGPRAHRPGPGRGGDPDHVQGRPFLGVRRHRPAPYAFGGRDRMDERHDMVRTARHPLPLPAQLRAAPALGTAPGVRLAGQGLPVLGTRAPRRPAEHHPGTLLAPQAPRGVVRPARRPRPGEEPGRRSPARRHPAPAEPGTGRAHPAGQRPLAPARRQGVRHP